jgi:hypothetical protein
MAIDKASEHKMCCQASFDESVLDVLLCKNHSHPPTPSEKKRFGDLKFMARLLASGGEFLDISTARS